MSAFKRFGDFIEGKKSDQTFTDEKYDGMLATKLPKEEKKTLPPDYDDEDEKGVVWVADGGDEGLGNKATPGITPKTTSLGDKPTGKVKIKKAVKMTTEQFLNETNNLQGADFIKYMSEANTDITTVSDLHGNEFTPDPTQTLQYAAGLLLGNPRLMQKFVREIKRRNGLKEVIEELLEHPETYNIVVEAMEDEESGKSRCHQIARSMNDKYVSAFDNIEFDDDIDESVDVGPDARWQTKPQGGAFGGGSGPDDTSMNQGDEGGVFSHKGNDERDNPMGGGGGPPFRGPSGAGQQGQQMGQGMQGQMQQQGQQGQMQQPKLKYMKESSSDRLLNEMGNYPHMKRSMKNICVGPDC